MVEAEIPIDLFNPGQVFACLGFLEAADALVGDAEGGFDWSDTANARFKLRVAGEQNPFEVVLEFLAEVQPQRWGPVGYKDPPPRKGKAADDEGQSDEETDEEDGVDKKAGHLAIELSEVFPAKDGDRMSLPIRIGGGNRAVIELGHWADGSGRNSFNLYAGNRSADKIASAMLMGVRKKASKKQRRRGNAGELRSKGLAQLWEESREELIANPLNVLTAMGGSFNFDPRGAWTPIDAGYSPNEHKHPVEASPVVEFLAAWGLENARPVEFDVRQVRYAVWGILLSPMLARAAFCGALTTVPLRYFRFELDMSGKNKVVTFADMETSP